MLSDGGHVVLLVSLLEPPAGLRVVELSPTVGVAELWHIGPGRGALDGR